MTTQTDPFDAIAAFIDGERVDAALLRAALAREDGRDYLVELVALREVVAHEIVPTATTAARSSRRWIVAVAAAIVLSLAGGYTLGHRSIAAGGLRTGTATMPAETAATDAAPAPTRVIEVAPGSSYVTKGDK